MPLTVLTGGARSGKSRWALRLATAVGGPVTLIATAEALDHEMAERIDRHRRERPAGWQTIEEPRELARAIRSVDAGATVIVDCLTLWLSNLLLDGLPDDDLLARASEAADVAAGHAGLVVVVTNEVGGGVVPTTELGRRFADLLGLVNQAWVERSERAALVVAGRLLWLPANGAQSMTETDALRATLAALPGPDMASMHAVADRAARVLRPTGALARLDEIAVWLAGWQRTERPVVRAPAALVFVADHGAASDGVSAYPASVTTEMLRALRSGRATASVLAREVGASVAAIDVGIGRPTGHIGHEPAMDADRFEACLAAGREAVAESGADLLVLGEMGIGNTTAASAVCAALFDEPAARWVGRGTGIDDAALVRKRAVVSAARRRISEVDDPLEILRQVGGSELVALAGAVVEARRRSVPVILDGFVVTAAVAPLWAIDHDALAHCLAGHRSAEAGHQRLLRRLGMTALLDLGLRLGEASGALAALPLVRMAAAAAIDVATFDEWGIGP